VIAVTADWMQVVDGNVGGVEPAVCTLSNLRHIHEMLLATAFMQS